VVILKEKRRFKMKHNQPTYSVGNAPKFCVNCGKDFKPKKDIRYNHLTGEKIVDIILECPKCKQTVREENY
jgi:hypothetical protein